jgi:hypothetical protein
MPPVPVDPPLAPPVVLVPPVAEVLLLVRPAEPVVFVEVVAPVFPALPAEVPPELGGTEDAPALLVPPLELLLLAAVEVVPPAPAPPLLPPCFVADELVLVPPLAPIELWPWAPPMLLFPPSRLLVPPEPPAESGEELAVHAPTDANKARRGQNEARMAFHA